MDNTEWTDTIDITRSCLLENINDWETRYEDYAREIINKKDIISNDRNLFHKWHPLYVYLNISQALSTTNHINFSLRFHGQNVAKIFVKNNKVIISTKKFDSTNGKHFSYKDSLDNIDWNSEKASNFRKFFSQAKIRTGNNEHRIESGLLKELEGRSAKNKSLTNIQPIKIFDDARFQMPTPIAGSKKKNVKYSSFRGGGIDILARYKAGSNTRLCIIEVKDEYNNSEPPTKVLKQALAYATFVQLLLRSKSGKEWWNLFGFSKPLPEKLDINVVCAMPVIDNPDKSFIGITIPIENDTFHLHYIYFKDNKNSVKILETSLSS